MSDELISLSIRHQIFVEGLKADRTNKWLASVAELSRELQARFAMIEYDNLGDLTKAKLAVLLADLVKITKRVFNTWLNSLIEWLKQYIGVDRDFWQFALAQYVLSSPDNEKSKDDVNAVFAAAPSEDAIYSTAKNDPMGANCMLPEAFLNGFALGSAAQIVNQTRKTWSNAETKDDLIKSIIGSPELKYRDGLLEKLGRQGQAASNTVIQHVAATTNMSVAQTNWLQYLWVSVLDSHTTAICIERNGHVYTYGEGPEPPAHINCRSSIIPFDGTGPVTMPSFKVWASGQSQEFINEAFDGDVPAAYEGAVKPIDLKAFVANRALIVA